MQAATGALRRRGAVPRTPTHGDVRAVRHHTANGGKLRLQIRLPHVPHGRTDTQRRPRAHLRGAPHRPTASTLLWGGEEGDEGEAGVRLRTEVFRGPEPPRTARGLVRPRSCPPRCRTWYCMSRAPAIRRAQALKVPSARVDERGGRVDERRTTESERDRILWKARANVGGRYRC